MNTSKRININVSSLVGLKAELLRKHTEVKNAKAKIDQNKPILPNIRVKNKKIKEKKIKSVTKEDITEIEDVDTLKKSKYMLIAKSRLYDKLKKNHGQGNDNYLVDFKKKDDESSSEDESSAKEDNYVDTNVDPEEDWVDYVDCFGRSRRCLRKDLPKMKEKDSLIEREVKKNSLTETVENEPQPAYILPQKEPEIEIMRKKWEEQTEKLAMKSDIHYQDILFDEARTHGVGYYAFSHDEDERSKQQANLEKLRRETEQKQREAKEIKELKNKIEENRLKTARIRARVRAGLPAEPVETEIEIGPIPNEAEKLDNEDSKSESLQENESKKNKSQPDEENDFVVEDKIKAFGELLGKRLPWRELSQEEWVDKRRKDRLGEFAPAYSNFKKAGILMSTRHNQVLLKKENDDDPLRISGNGPEPTDIWEASEFSSTIDDSDTIGPMPPPAPIQDDDILAQIPLPDNPPSTTTVHTSPRSKLESPSIEKIEAGLKYLRQKFEKNES